MKHGYGTSVLPFRFRFGTKAVRSERLIDLPSQFLDSASLDKKHVILVIDVEPWPRTPSGEEPVDGGLVKVQCPSVAFADRRRITDS